MSNTIVQTPEQLKDLHAFIKASPRLTIDIETTGLNRRKDTIIGFGLSFGGNAFYLPIYSWDVGTASLVPDFGAGIAAPDVLRQLIGKELWTWNGAFDLAFIHNTLGINLVPYLHIDGMLLAHTVNENRFSYGLKDIAQVEFGANIKQEQEDMKASIKANGGTAKQYFKADTKLMAVYCMQDCLLTDRLINKMYPELISERLDDFFQAEVMEHYRVVTIPMEQRGIRIDLPLIKQTQTEITEDIRSLEQTILTEIGPNLGIFRTWLFNKDYPPSRTGAFAQAYAEVHQCPLPRTKAGKLSMTVDTLKALPEGHHKHVLLQTARMSTEEVLATQSFMWAQEGSPGFNLLSKHHLKKLFFDTLKEKPTSYTPPSKTYPKGQPQVDDEFLDLMARKYPWAEQLRTYNRLNKIKGTYVDRFIDEAEGDRFYASYKQHGTVTGRLSGDLQQLPRPVEDGPEVVRRHINQIRNFFIADEGHVLIDADYESLEPHVFAHISKDPAVIDIFKQGHDFYSTVAIRTEGLHAFSADKKAHNYLGKHDKAKRQSAKAYALGVAYGEEAYKLAHELGFVDETINVLFSGQEQMRQAQAQAQKIIDGYWAGFPMLKKTSDAGREHILQHGFIASETGRRRRLYEAKAIADKHGSWILNSLELWKEYKDRGSEYDHMKVMRKRLKKALNAAINFPTQSLSASIVMRAGIAVNKSYLAENIPALVVGQFHDELLVSCQKGFEARAAAILQHQMENIYKLSVDLKAEPVIGLRYGAIK